MFSATLASGWWMYLVFHQKPPCFGQLHIATVASSLHGKRRHVCKHLATTHKAVKVKSSVKNGNGEGLPSK